MPKVAQLPTSNGAPHENGVEARHVPRFQHRFYAFLSYSHQDEALADWLHHELEQFHVPRSLAGRLTAAGVIPKRLAPIFRDRHELAAADDLGGEIKAALTSSQFLIVLCSPAAAKSRWVNTEIEAFKRSRPEGCVLAAIASGEPFASETLGHEDDECFPPALRQKFRRGRSSGKRAEPLGADFREGGEGKRLAFLKLVAGMLGVGLDDLVRREATRRQRRLGYAAAASLAGMAVTSTLAVVAIQSRDAARDQRREAEGLIGFMLGDLRDKLEPIGKLDALDGVGSRVLAYYQKLGTTDLSDAALSQRSKALSLMAEVANLRGDRDGALRLYREAAAGTAEAVRRAPADPQRLFDHAQNVFWIGDISRLRGQLGTAESSYRLYKQLADQMVTLEPDNLRWRMETQYAEANLGILYYQQRRHAEADRAFTLALGTIQALASVEPANVDYQKSLSDGLAWLADTKRAEGQIDQAIALRNRQITLLSQLAGRNDDVDFDLRAIPGHRALALLLESKGQREPAETELRLAIAAAEKLISVDSQNAEAKGLAASAHLELARILLATSGDQSAAEARVGCDLAGELVARDATVYRWRVAQSECFALRATLAAEGNGDGSASQLAERAVAIGKSLNSGDPINDRYVLASYQRQLGDVRQRAGDRSGAVSAWNAALSGLPTGVVERPWELNERFQLFRRLGRMSEAQPLAQKLAALDYRGSH